MTKIRNSTNGLMTSGLAKTYRWKSKTGDNAARLGGLPLLAMRTIHDFISPLH
jgi:hypothetical protein